MVPWDSTDVAGRCSMRPLPHHITALYLAVVVSCMFHIALVGADVLVYSQTNGQLVEGIKFQDAPTPFGSSIPIEGLKGLLVYSSPATACSAIERPPANKTTYADKWIVLIRRCDCTFEEKVRNAEEAGYAAAIIHNVNSSGLDTSWLPGCDPLPIHGEPMSANGPTNITIPSVFVGEDTGVIIRDICQWFEHRYYIVIKDDVPLSNFGVILFALGFLFVLFLLKLLIEILKIIIDHMQAWCHQRPSSALKKITTTRCKSKDPYKTCAICLKDCLEGDKLRTLPCSHAFHCKCIDPLLRCGPRDCPVCKRKVIAQDERVPDGDDRGGDGEAPQNQRVVPLESDEIDDERAPLITQYSRDGGTFQNQRENPFLGAARCLRGSVSPAMAALPPPSTMEDDSSPSSTVISGSFSPNSVPNATEYSREQLSTSVVNPADHSPSSKWMSVNSSPADVQDVTTLPRNA